MVRHVEGQRVAEEAGSALVHLPCRRELLTLFCPNWRYEQLVLWRGVGAAE